jgi:hypothetical protein
MGSVRLSPKISCRVGGLGGFDFRSGGRISKTRLAAKIELFRDRTMKEAPGFRAKGRKII